MVYYVEIFHRREVWLMLEEKGICYIVGAMPLDEGFSFQPKQQDLVIAADGG